MVIAYTLLKKTQERSLEVKVCMGVNLWLRDVSCKILPVRLGDAYLCGKGFRKLYLLYSFS